VSAAASIEPSRLVVLCVNSEEDDRQNLAEIFRQQSWKLHFSSSIAQAKTLIPHHGYSLVICDAALCDGTWDVLFRFVECAERPPLFVVSSRLADERLWSEALNLGAFDVLSTPFDRHEVSHVVRCGWDSWMRSRKPAASTEEIGTAGDQRVIAASGSF
jgi:DNA-binding NtrC family response regulator